MKKQEAIKIVNNHLQNFSLNKDNTHISKINSGDRSVWWLHIPPERFSNNLHLLLKKTDSFLWLKINANTFTNPQDVFRLRADKNKIDLEISSDKKNHYMIDIKSGGKNYDFIPHLEKEFKNTEQRSTPDRLCIR